MTDSQAVHDLLVIGGGINGAGIAADAAGRGLDVVLCEKSDLAGATSSWSTKLIHGGLRYLEHYQFGLVRKSLKERELLAGLAPHIIRPLAFQIPRLPGSRNPLLLRAGLLLYDHLARRRRFKASRALRFADDGPLRADIRRGFEYWDAQVDDSRLVVLNAMQARRRGATILTRTECLGLEPDAGAWRVQLRNRKGEPEQLRARAVVNASGPWVSALLQRLTDAPAPHPLRLVKGSHLVLPRIHDGEQAFLLQHDDGRVVFVIPYLGRYSLVGTTEEEFHGDLDQVSASEAEIDYLLAIVNHYFRRPVSRAQIVRSYSGIRPLLDSRERSASRVSRDYRLELTAQPHPLLSVYGGKVTTYRILAQQALARLAPFFPQLGPAWTRSAPLPGGDFVDRDELRSEVAERFPWLETELLQRWLASYGTLLLEIIGDAAAMADLGPGFGADLYQREVDYLREQEWALTAEDVLWRRSKLGYDFSPGQVKDLAAYLAQAAARPAG